jgi:lysophospholipase L1-like esterase
MPNPEIEYSPQALEPSNPNVLSRLLGLRKGVAAGLMGVAALVGSGCTTSPGGTGNTIPTIPTVIEFEDEIITGCDSNNKGDYSAINLMPYSFDDYMRQRGVETEKTGVNGDGLFGSADERLLQVVDSKLASGQAPEDLTVLMMCGSNDIPTHSPQEIADEFAQLNYDLAERNVPMLAVSIPHVTGIWHSTYPEYNPKISETNDLLKQQFGEYMFLDLSNDSDMTVLGNPNTLRYDRNVGDGIHWNKAAQDIAGDKMIQKLNSLALMGAI